MNIYEQVSIGLYMLLMISIGLYSYRKSSRSSEDFLIGGRHMGAAVTALSAGAADMSGWLLLFRIIQLMDSYRINNGSFSKLCINCSSFTCLY